MTSAAFCEQGCPKCFYCDAHLSPRHEHDHYPTPARVGGENTVPTCLNCHDLKDRVYLRNWRTDVLDEAMRQAGPLGRILLAKCSALIADLESEERAA